MSLHEKGLHELRGIAQGCDAVVLEKLFSMDKPQLIQAIEAKLERMAPDPVIDIPKPEYDARLMTKPPSKSSTQDDIVSMLVPYTNIGMHLTFPDPESWHMQHGRKEDTGSMRMPLRNILQCAAKVMGR